MRMNVRLAQTKVNFNALQLAGNRLCAARQAGAEMAFIKALFHDLTVAYYSMIYFAQVCLTQRQKWFLRGCAHAGSRGVCQGLKQATPLARAGSRAKAAGP
jgi:hypothetical protein